MDCTIPICRLICRLINWACETGKLGQQVEDRLILLYIKVEYENQINKLSLFSLVSAFVLAVVHSCFNILYVKYYINNTNNNLKANLESLESHASLYPCLC